MLESLFGADVPSALAALGQVLMIDLVLAGDNAVAVGLAAAGLPLKDRRRVILWGLAAAVALRIVFALITTQLLSVIGLLLAGGVLLLWVCWRMYRDLASGGHEDDQGEALVEDAVDHDSESSEGPEATAAALAAAPKGKTFRQAFTQVFLADVSMSLDNVLAVAGAAREHPGILVFGLIVSIVLMGVAATFIARLLGRYRWIGYVGLIVVLYVAGHMIWDGSRDVACDTGREAGWNRLMPDLLDLSPEQCTVYRG